MAYADKPQMSNSRIAAIVLVALIHALLGYAFVTGLAYNVVKKVAADLKTFNVEEPPPPDQKPPPPPPPQPPRVAATARASRASRPRRRRWVDRPVSGAPARSRHGPPKSLSLNVIVD